DASRISSTGVTREPCLGLLVVRSLGFAFLPLHHNHFIHLPGFVISGPFAELLAVLEVTRAQPGSVFPEPLPITGGHAIGHFPFRPDAAAFMVRRCILALLLSWRAFI